MHLITEEAVKKIIKAGRLVLDGKLHLPADCMLTPSAKAAVIDSKLTLVLDKRPAQALPGSDATKELPLPSEKNDNGALSPALASSDKRRYRLQDGSELGVKPEHMTQLQANVLVTKDDMRIQLRGQIDMLIAELLKAQWRIAQRNVGTLVDDLEEVYGFIGKLSRAEVLEEPFVIEKVIGLAYDEVRDVSHHPQRSFGRGHLFNISYKEGEVVLLLNALRAQSRQCELTFYEAFKTEDGSVTRADLMEGFNRLSSIFYILSLRAAVGWYGEQQ